jgi:glycine cleavage system H protein
MKEQRMEFPKELRYSQEHEWAAIEENIATIGITDYAQEQLGDVVYIELPEVGTQVTKDEAFGVVESVKAVSDVYAPVSGTVTEINVPLPDSPETINDDPYGEGWLIKVKLTHPEEAESLLDAAEYRKLLDS